jgi:hypothetical protein
MAQKRDLDGAGWKCPQTGGAAEMLHPPELGIPGNSHMILQDRNNLQIAALILQWIGRTTRGDAAGSR